VASQIEKVAASSCSQRLRFRSSRLSADMVGASEGANYVRVIETALDRREVSLVWRSQRDDAIAKRWVRTR
jgi:hypothetical protein